MAAIHLDQLSFAYSSAVEVFNAVTLHLGSGWTGVVGPNGAGKSTLLSLIAGELSPSSGHLILDPSGARLARCRQEVEVATPEIEAFAGAADGLSRRWLGRLGIEATTLQRWETLSPGERRRWQLGAALASDPNILLLDEPTNHLDSGARELIEEALGHFDGVGLVISHDRGFLDRLATRTLQVGAGTLRLWSAPYSVALAEWTAEEASRLEEHATARRNEKALRRRLADERRAADKRNAGFQRQARQAGPRDHDARSMGEKERHESGKVAGQRRRTVLRASLERAGATADDLAPDRVLGGSIYFDFEPSPKRRLLRFSGSLRAGSTLLAENVEAVVHRGDRIRLVGPNGAGKSTLLRALLDGGGIPSDRLLYLPLELSRAGIVRLVAGLEGLPNARRGRVLAIVAALGVDPDDLLASAHPSPGEARKLAIALGLGVGAWVMVLDEPTNHLDLPAVERIESALDAYPGALLVVTHDDTFGTRTTNTIWRLESGMLSVAGVAGQA